MKPSIARIGIALALVLAGWTLGRGQSAQPDFVLVVDAPAGTTNIECQQTFTFSCGGRAPDARCSSYQVGGWLTR